MSYGLGKSPGGGGGGMRHSGGGARAMTGMRTGFRGGLAPRSAGGLAPRGGGMQFRGGMPAASPMHGGGGHHGGHGHQGNWRGRRGRRGWGGGGWWGGDYYAAYPSYAYVVPTCDDVCAPLYPRYSRAYNICVDRCEIDGSLYGLGQAAPTSTATLLGVGAGIAGLIFAASWLSGHQLLSNRKGKRTRRNRRRR